MHKILPKGRQTWNDRVSEESQINKATAHAQVLLEMTEYQWEGKKKEKNPFDQTRLVELTDKSSSQKDESQ